MVYPDNFIPKMTSNTAPSGTVSAIGNAGADYVEWRAFDHQNASYQSWYYAGATGWLQYQFPDAHVVARYAVTSMNNENYSHPPKSWTFQGSNNGTDWTTLDTQANVIDWAALANVRKVFDFANSTAYAYYRLDITATNDVGEMAIGELEMMEKVRFYRRMWNGQSVCYRMKR